MHRLLQISIFLFGITVVANAQDITIRTTRETQIALGYVDNKLVQQIVGGRFDTMYAGGGLNLHIVHYAVKGGRYQFGFGTGVNMINRENQREGYKTAQIPLFLSLWVPVARMKNNSELALQFNLGVAWVVDCKHKPPGSDKFISISTTEFNRTEGSVDIGLIYSINKKYTVGLSFQLYITGDHRQTA